MHILIGQLFFWLIHCLPGSTLTSQYSHWPCRISNPWVADAGGVVYYANPTFATPLQSLSLFSWRPYQSWNRWLEVKFLSQLKGCWWSFSQAAKSMWLLRHPSYDLGYSGTWPQCTETRSRNGLVTGRSEITVRCQRPRNTNTVTIIPSHNRPAFGQKARCCWYVILVFSWSRKG